MEVVLTVRQTLQKKYGGATGQVDQALARLATAHAAARITSCVIYADDPASLAPYGVSPISAITSAEIKRVIDQVDKSLSAGPSPLEAVLLVGGDNVVPFHRVPNPVRDPQQQDPDHQVLTENLYASTDQELLVVQRALGRIPDAAETTPNFLVNVLGQIAALHGPHTAPSGSFGLSASVWSAASRGVYGNLPAGRPLQFSPPENQGNFQSSWINKTQYCYFNLHGAETTDSWYGSQPNFPVALRPPLITGSKLTGAVYFSEACYGANIISKRPGDAICLTALAGGVACFVGSTEVAYGPATPPPTDADLLGILFFKNVMAHQPLGHALMNAKQDFFRQSVAAGALDETAQKTLLEFVFYGDPSLKV